MRKRSKRLVLDRETVRVLGTRDLADALGGGQDTTTSNACTEAKSLCLLGCSGGTC